MFNHGLAVVLIASMQATAKPWLNIIKLDCQNVLKFFRLALL